MADDDALTFDLDGIPGEEAFDPANRKAADEAVEAAQRQQQESEASPEPEPITEPEVPEPQADATPESSPGDEVVEDPQARNFKALREVVAREKEEKKELLQQLERERAERIALEAARKVNQQQPQPQPEQKLPDFNEDPQAWIDAKLEQERVQMANQMANMSEQHARQALGSAEVDRRMQVYQQLAATDPSLDQRVRSSASPWLSMCDEVKKHEDLGRLSELGDIDAYREKVRQEVRAELAAELGAQVPSTPQVKPEDLPSSLASVSSASPPSALEAVDESLDDVLHPEGAPY